MRLKRLAFSAAALLISADSAIAALKEQHAKLRTIEKTTDLTKLESVQRDIVDVENKLAELEDAIKIFGS